MVKYKENFENYGGSRVRYYLTLYIQYIQYVISLNELK